MRAIDTALTRFQMLLRDYDPRIRNYLSLLPERSFCGCFPIVLGHYDMYEIYYPGLTIKKYQNGIHYIFDDINKSIYDNLIPEQVLDWLNRDTNCRVCTFKFKSIVR